MPRWRRLVPVARILDPQARPNLLPLEAAAAASVLDAGIAVATEGPSRTGARDALGIAFHALGV